MVQKRFGRATTISLTFEDVIKGIPTPQRKFGRSKKELEALRERKKTAEAIKQSSQFKQIESQRQSQSKIINKLIEQRKKAYQERERLKSLGIPLSDLRQEFAEQSGIITSSTQTINALKERQKLFDEARKKLVQALLVGDTETANKILEQTGGLVLTGTEAQSFVQGTAEARRRQFPTPRKEERQLKATLTTIPAQKFGIRVIDTSEGTVIIEGQSESPEVSFKTPATEILKDITFEPPKPELVASLPTDALSTFQYRKGQFIPALAGGVLEEFINLEKFIFKSATKPTETNVAVLVGVGSVGKKVVTGEGFPEIGEMIRTQPGRTTGKVLGQILIFKGSERLIKGLSYKDIFIGQEIEQTNLLVSKKIITYKTGEAIKSGISVQKYFLKQPDVPISRQLTSTISPELTTLEKEVFLKTLETKGIKGFGSQAIRLRGLEKPGGDIDLAIKDIKVQNVLSEAESQLRLISKQPIFRGKEALGLGKEKAIDVKPLSRLEAFPFSQKPIKPYKSSEFKITTTAEQYTRNIAGLLDLRKGGKDIGGAILSGRGLLQVSRQQLKATKIPILKQIRQIKLAGAERKFVKFETALPEINKLVLRVGEGTIPEEVFRLKPIQPTEYPKLFKGKGGRLFPGGFKPEPVKLDLLPESKTPKLYKELKGINKPFKSSDFSKLKVKPSKFGGIPPLKSSELGVSNIPKSKFGVSRISTSKFGGTGVPSSTFQTPRIIPSHLTGISPSKIGISGLGGGSATGGETFITPPPEPKVNKKGIGRKGMKEKELFPGFFTYVIRGGKKVRLPGVRSRGGALRYGTLRTQQTLRATFGIEPAGVKIKVKQLDYRPPKNVFREYRIKKGKKIPLQNVYIQRTTKEGGLPGGRLRSRLEVGAIQRARR